MQKPSTYKEVLDFLYEQLPMFQRVGPAAFKKDLTNIRLLCDALGNPQLSFPSIHIAGTNGKGSTTHILANLLRVNGKKVGIYTSPHFKDYRERIKINKTYIPEDDVQVFVVNNFDLIQSIQPSFFEITVALAFWFFQKEKVDIAVIETGLGGRLDSTNILNPILSVITNIGFDHMEFLGDTLQEIALEKAGIMKSNVPCVIGERQVETTLVFEKKAAQKQCDLFYADQIAKISRQPSALPTSASFHFQTDDSTFPFSTNMGTEVQERNLLTALASYNILCKQSSDYHWNSEIVQKGVENIPDDLAFYGRFQILGTKPTIIADGAHNREGLRALFRELIKIKYNNLWIVYGTVRDKSLDVVLPELPQDAYYICTQADVPRAMPADELSGILSQKHLINEVQMNPHDALGLAREKALPDDLIIVTGSMFLIAEVL